MTSLPYPGPLRPGPDTVSSLLEPPSRLPRQRSPGLAEAVAAVVALAAERARATGDFAAFRSAVEAALRDGAG